MKVLLTGATGYIGHQLAIKLAKQNYKVNALVRDLESNKIPKHNNIRPVKGNICNYESIQNAKNVLKASLTENIKKVIYTSTLSVFGPSLFHVPITEDQPRIASYTNDYELTKTMSEEVVSDYVKKGLPCTILNVSRVYGPGLNTFSNGVNKIISKIIKDKVLYVPDKLNVEANYVYIQDVLNAQILALEKGENGEKYIIGGENSDYNLLFKKIKNIADSKISIFKINYNLVKSGIAFINGFNWLSGNGSTLTPKVLDSLFTNRSASSQKAIATLNYKITPLKIGLEQTINFLSK
jgi:nucleoside-diphosphate-sugar epimerase